MTAFVPRGAFPNLESLPRSYFLGHHRAGLNKMKTMLTAIDLVIECRDYRVPLTSRNPLFEETLGERERLIVYTKQDLGSQGKPKDQKREEIIRRWHRPCSILFSDHRSIHSVRKVLNYARNHAAAADSILGSRMMIVGMPNVGKSSLLNALRQLGVRKGKAAQTGAQPGVTRKIATSVKIIDGGGGGRGREGEDVYLVDTPGVFVPYMPDAESMLKLALAGSVKDTIIAPAILADYLLYQLNLQAPCLYAEYCGPTNDVSELLAAVARKTGRLQKGGTPDVEASALWLVQRWRTGHLGRFVLDEIDEDGLESLKAKSEGMGGSLSQARRAAKDLRRQRSKAQLDTG